MNNFVITYSGSDWIASTLAGNYKKPNVMYVVYSNSGDESLALTTDMDAQSFSGLTGGLWFMRVTDGVVSTTVPTSGDYAGNSVVYSCIAGKSDIADVKSDVPALESGTSKIITVALCYSEDTSSQPSDKVLAVCNMTKSGAADPVPWADNLDLSVSCPITINAYPLD